MTDRPDLERAYALETTEDNRLLYRDWADTYDSDFIAATGYQLPGIVARTYLDACGLWPCLDAGCGTGVLADHLPEGAVIDGLDLSPEMLAVARAKGRYRTLMEGNLKEALALPDAAYGGLVSSGTFTHGHVGPEALPELVRVLAPDAVAVITVKPVLWRDMHFAAAFGALARDGLIEEPRIDDVRIYARTGTAPEGHADDTAFIVTFRRR